MNEAHADVLLCKRIYTYSLGDDRIEATASVFTPVECETGEYGCRYTVLTSQESLERTIYGIDALQALHLALFILRSDLMLLGAGDDWRWLGGKGLGLPLTAGVEGATNNHIPAGEQTSS